VFWDVSSIDYKGSSECWDAWVLLDEVMTIATAARSVLDLGAFGEKDSRKEIVRASLNQSSTALGSIRGHAKLNGEVGILTGR